MSTETVKEQIKRFLNSRKPEVLAIRGSWGVGKTHLWKSQLEELGGAGEIELNKYSYVSLFGVNSLGDLKWSIFENTVSTDNASLEPNAKTLEENARKAEPLFRKVLKHIPYIRNFDFAAEAMAYMSVNEIIVCMDDFERKGDQIGPKEIMGLVSQLVEKKSCKVVLILNEDSFGDDDGKEFRMYREKVIDVELLFSPTVDECQNIAFAGENTGLLYDSIRENAKKLNITNIRVLRKIERLALDLQKHLGDYESEVLEECIKTLVLCCASFYAQGQGKLPTLDYIKDFRRVLNLPRGIADAAKISKDADKVSKNEEDWSDFMREYGHVSADEVDLAIAEAVEVGYIDEGALRSLADQLNRKVIEGKAKAAELEAWNLYHDSFRDNEEDVLEALTKPFDEYIGNLSLSYLDGVASLFRRLGRESEAVQLVERFIAARSDEIELFNLKAHAFSGDLQDSYLKEKFAEKHNEYIRQNPRSVREIMIRFSERKSLSQDDLGVLSRAEVDEYVQLFESKSGKKLSDFISTCLGFKKSHDLQVEHRAIVEKVEDALRTIGTKSKLNADRMIKYGIRPSDDDQEGQ